MRLTSLVAGALIVLFATTAEAHRRAYRHHHPLRDTRAVIVVGKPRTVRPVVIDGVAHGTLDMNVDPRSTEVWVDGRFRGICDAFDGHPNKLHLRPGTHRVRLVTPEGLEVAREIRVRAGVEVNIGIDLRS